MCSSFWPAAPSLFLSFPLPLIQVPLPLPCSLQLSSLPSLVQTSTCQLSAKVALMVISTRRDLETSAELVCEGESDGLVEEEGPSSPLPTIPQAGLAGCVKRRKPAEHPTSPQLPGADAALHSSSHDGCTRNP